MHCTLSLNVGLLCFSRWRCFLLACVCLLWAAGDARSAGDSVKITDVSIGFDNTFKVGCWTPISVTLDGISGHDLAVRLTMPDPDGNPTILPSLKVEANDGSGQAVGLIRYGRIGGAIQVEVLEGERVLTQKTLSYDNRMILPVPQDRQLWMLIGEHPALRLAATRWNQVKENSVFLSSPDELPPLSSALGLEGIDAVIVQASEKVSPRLSNQLKIWVERGGQLLVIIGDDVDNLRTSPLASWIPQLTNGIDDLRDLGNLATLVPGSSTLRVRGSLAAARFNVTASDGQILASSLSGPLAVRSAYGTGIVTQCGVDLRDRPLSTWDEQLSTAELALSFLGLPAPWKSSTGAKLASTADSSELNPTGVSDFQTQLLNSVDQFDNIPRPAPLTVWAWLGLLTLILGPLDYLLVHRILKRPQLTWITFPAWLALVSFLAMQAATRANTSPLKARQIDLIDVDATSQTARGRSWFGFYSPVTQRYAVTMRPEQESLHVPEISEGYLGWMERAETSYRGMYRKGGLDFGKPAYTYSNDSLTVENLPVRIWSTGGLEGYWESRGDKVSSLVESHLADDGSRRLSGHFVHHLPGEISDWMVAYENFAYYLSLPSGGSQGGDSLQAGQKVDIGKVRSNILKGFLVGQTYSLVKGKSHEEDRTAANRNEYDPFSRDPFGILRTMTFHEAAGGQSYTGLNNHPLMNAELSRLLKLNRAVLFGRLSLPSTRFLLDGQVPNLEQQDSFVRIILPVNRSYRDPSAPPSPDLLELKK